KRSPNQNVAVESWSSRRKHLTTLSRVRTSVASPVSGAAGRGEAHRGDGTRDRRRPKGNSAAALYLPDLNTQRQDPWPPNTPAGRSSACSSPCSFSGDSSPPATTS